MEAGRYESRNETGQRTGERALGEGLTSQSWRNISIAVSRKYLRKGEGRFKHDEEDWVDERQEDEIDDMQAGHGTHVAGIVYARGIREQDGVVESMREKFGRASENWHRFWGFQMAGKGVRANRKRKPTGWEEEAEQGRRKRQRRLRTIDTEMELRKMMGNKQAEFRGLQKSIVESIMAGQERILDIIPTGEGKSLLFMLPAFYRSGAVTVVSRPVVIDDVNSCS
ncbi:MAG: hypothetical protein Q9194_007711 [Teloschistes cf. exilis]